MRVFAFHLRQILLLGTAGYVLFVLAIAGYAGHWLVSGDGFIEWLLALAVTAVFICMLATPLQFALRHTALRQASVLFGANQPIYSAWSK